MGQDGVGRAWILGKLKQQPLPVVLFLILAWVLHDTFGALAAKVDSRSALIALVSLGGLLVFMVLMVVTFVHLYHLQLEEIRRIAGERNQLQELVMQPRLTTARKSPRTGTTADTKGGSTAMDRTEGDEGRGGADADAN